MMIKWDPTGLGLICPHCGTPNPDRGDRCGNCDGNPFILPKKDELLTREELLTLKAVKRLAAKKTA
jgi:ribosomal protein L40E